MTPSINTSHSNEDSNGIQYHLPLIVNIDADEVGANPVFNLTGPSFDLEWGTTVNIDNLDAVTIHGDVIAAGGQYENDIELWGPGIWNIANGTITGDLAVEGALGNDNDHGGIIHLTDSVVTGDASAKAKGEITLTGTRLTGDVVAQGNATIESFNSDVIGNVTAQGQSTFSASDNSFIDGKVTAQEDADITLKSTFITNDITAYDDSQITITENSTVGGHQDGVAIGTVIADGGTIEIDYSTIGSNGGTGDVQAINSGTITVSGAAKVLGTAQATGAHSEITINDSEVNHVKAEGGGYILLENSSQASGLTQATGVNSEITINDSEINDVGAENGAHINLENSSQASGLAQATGANSTIAVSDSIVNDIEAQNGAIIRVNKISIIRGNATANGADAHVKIGEAVIDNAVKIGTLDNGMLQENTGDLKATDGGQIDVAFRSEVYGNVRSIGANSAVTLANGAVVGVKGQANTGNLEATDGGYIGATVSGPTVGFGGTSIFGNATSTGSGSLIEIHHGSTVGTRTTENQITWEVQDGTGDITALDGGNIEVKGYYNSGNYENSLIYGNATASGTGAVITLKGAVVGNDKQDGAGNLQDDTGDITAINGGRINVDRSQDNTQNAHLSESVILGNAQVIGEGSSMRTRASSIGTVQAGSHELLAGTGNVSVVGGGFLNAQSGTKIQGNLTVDGIGSRSTFDDSVIGHIIKDASTFEPVINPNNTVDHGEIELGTGNITVSNGATADIGGGTTIFGDITASGEGSKVLLGLTNIFGNIDVSGSSEIGIDSAAVYLGKGPTYNASNGNITASDNAEVFLGGNEITILGGGTFNDNATLRINGENFMDKVLSFNDNAVFAPNILTDGQGLNVGRLAISDGAVIRPYFDNWYGWNNHQNGDDGITGRWGPFTVEVGEENAVTVLNYNLREGSDFTIISPLNLGVIYTSDPASDNPGTGGGGGDIGIIGGVGIIDGDGGTEGPPPNGNGDSGPSGGAGAVQVYLIDNTVDFSPFNGSQNEKVVAAFVSDFVNSYQDQSEGAALELKDADQLANDLGLNAESAQLLQKGNIATYLGKTAYYGDLRAFNGLNFSNDSDLPDLSSIIPLANSVSAQAAQSFWNQQQFIGDVNDAMRSNDILGGGSPFPPPPNPFPLNFASSANNTGFQLATLQRIMTPTVEHLSAAGNNVTSPNSGVWAAYNGRRQHVKGDSGIGSNSWDSSSNGFSLGYTNSGDRFSWGAAIGHQKANLHFSDVDITGEQKGWNAGLYGSLHRGQLYLNGILSYGSYDNDTYSSLGTSSSKNKATSISLETGKHFAIGKNSSLTPYASAAWTNIKQNDASSSSGIVLSGGSSHLVNTELGVRYRNHKYDDAGAVKCGLMAGVAWAHQGKDTGLSSSFTIPGAGTSGPIQAAPLANNSLVLQLGAYGRIQKNVIGFAKYQGMFGSGQRIHGISAGVGYQF